MSRLGLLDRVRLRSEPEPNSGCWLWTGATNQRGYAKMSWQGRVEYATRALLGLQPGDGKVARHRCDVPSCVNPDHIEAGTFDENMQDAVDRRRFPHARKSTCVHGHPLDESNARVTRTTRGGIQRKCRVCARATYLRRKHIYNARRRKSGAAA